MSINSNILFIEIDDQNLKFIAGKNDDLGNFSLVKSFIVPQEGYTNNQISDFNLVLDNLKKNINLIEQNTNYEYKDVILVINNFDNSIINFSGFKKLNNSQLLKENIIYIINSLKTKISEIESQKKILHIFNTKFFLDKKETDNLPIGLFGNFYSHELSFFLINNNDYKNLKNIFEKCNLRISKIISKCFIEGVNQIENNSDMHTFFKIEINKKNSQIFFFENSALKYIQNFDFGSELIINDISKIIGLSNRTVKDIISNSFFSKNLSDKDFLDKKYFKDLNFRKIKKKLILDIADARIKEILELIIIRNINLSGFISKKMFVLLKIIDKNILCFEESFQRNLSIEKKFKLTFLEDDNLENLYKNAFKIVQYGWKKEAVPIIHHKKSIISRFFDLIFK